MTEKEAKTKWCPYGSGRTRHESGEMVSSAQCIASDCMMWVVDMNRILDQLEVVYIKEEVIGGHCGLAGKQ